MQVQLVENTPKDYWERLSDMHIEISQRLRPFTHRPGMASILPGTGERVVVYPTMVGGQYLPISGPVKGFTHQLDLEKGCLSVYGHAKEGFFR